MLVSPDFLDQSNQSDQTLTHAVAYSLLMQFYEGCALPAVMEIIELGSEIEGKEASQNLKDLAVELLEHHLPIGKSLKQAAHLGRDLSESAAPDLVRRVLNAATKSSIVDTKFEISALDELSQAGVRTADPMRTLIRIPGYGESADSAFSMEKMIASATTVGKITKSRDEIESHLAQVYLEEFRHGGFIPLSESEQAKHIIPNYAGREYKYAAPMAKHKSYELKILSLTANRGRQMFHVALAGADREFAGLMHSDDGIDFILPQDPTLIADTLKRSDELLAQVTEGR